MSISKNILFQDLAAAMSQVAQLERKAATFIQADYEKAKAEITEALEHFKAEVARLRGVVDPRIVEHIDDGLDPHSAMLAANSGALTSTEAAVKAAEEALTAEVAAAAAAKTESEGLAK